MKIRIRVARVEDAYELGEGLRKGDRLELEAHGWTYPFSDALLALLETCDKALTMICRGDVIAMATTHSAPDEDGVAWVSILGSNEVSRNSIGFIRGCRSRMSYLEDGYERMVSMADARNPQRLRFLVAFGYQTVGKIEVNGREFWQMTKNVSIERFKPKEVTP